MPILVCLNHPSWWDPLFALYLSQHLFCRRQNYAPIAAVGLEKYKFFERLGFFGIDPKTVSGSARFLRIGEAVLQRSDGVLWVTAQGQFTDVRRRPVVFEPGVGSLAHRCSHFAMLPLALEYTFWNERYPEAFLCLGSPVIVQSGHDRTAMELAQLFAQKLEQTQDILAQKVMERQSQAFEVLIKGRAGIGGIYDAWRSVKSRMSGKHFQREHGSD